MDEVSIIIPTYNRADTLEKSIQSVLNQTYSEFELLIIDDGSTDDTEHVLEKICDYRIRYIKMDKNKGVSAARNEGIRQARYNYIAFQDSDDCWREDKLEKQMNFLINNPHIGLVYCAYECRESDGSIMIVPDERIPEWEKQGNIYHYMLRRNTIGAPAVVLRRECLPKTELFHEELTCLEDWELFLRISQKCEIAFLDEVLLFVNMKEDGVSHNKSGYYDARCYMAAKHKEELLHYGIFQDVVEDILVRAEKSGVLKQVAAILQCYLQ